MYDTRTVRSGYIVAYDYTERIAHRLNPRDKLLVTDALQLLALEGLLLNLESALLLLAEVGTYQIFRHNDSLASFGVWVLALYANILNLRTYAERSVRWKCPRGCCPSEEE